METDKIFLYTKRALILILVFVMQTVFADKIRVLGVSPNFVFAALLVIFFKNYPSYGLYAALVMGLVTDAISGRIFGAYTFLFVLIEELIKNFYTKMFTENFFFECLGGIFFNFLFSLMYGLGEWIFYGSFLNIFLEITLVECIYNQIIFMIFLFISKKTKKKRRSIFRI